jgi:NAD-dependent SIR2 family protein deacetylase
MTEGQAALILTNLLRQHGDLADCSCAAHAAARAYLERYEEEQVAGDPTKRAPAVCRYCSQTFASEIRRGPAPEYCDEHRTPKFRMRVRHRNRASS